MPEVSNFPYVEPVRNNPFATQGAVALPQGVGAIATDNNVPEGHKGLHGFLYGEAGAEVHDDEGREYQTRDVSLCTLLPVLPLSPSATLAQLLQLCMSM